MPFEVTRRLRFGDCDPSGIAFFPKYLELLVGVTEDLFASAGWDWPRLAREHDIATPTVRLDCTFVAPGFQGDALTFACRVVAIGNSSLDLRHEIAAAHPLWRAEQRIVATSATTHRAQPWPDPVRVALAAYLEPDDA